MATENPALSLSYEAAADLSTAQFKIVRLTGERLINLVATDGAFGIGILQDDPIAGEPGNVIVLGESKVVVATGETLNPGDFWGSTNVGTATRVDATSTGADLGDWMLGVVVKGATGPAIATVICNPIGRVTA